MLDTATDTEIVGALTDNNAVVSIRSDSVRHSQNLMATIDRVLSEASLPLDKIDLVLCGTGPGSFTGLRIGVVCARTFAQILGIKAASFPSHEIFCCHPFVKKGDRVAVAFDAKKQRVYASVFEFTDYPFGYKIVFPTEDCDPAVIEPFIDETCWLAGDYFSKHTHRTQLLPRPDPEICSRYARSIAESVLRGERETRYEMIAPDYCRKSDAEIARDSAPSA